MAEPRILFPAAEVIAEEVHSGKAWAALLAISLAGMIGAVFFHAAAPPRAIRIVIGATAVILIFAAAMAWDGFHYYFTTRGLEIRTLGIRVKWLSAGQIKEYAAGTWSVGKGYGIRGIGNRRAYVWGNRGVRVQTAGGEVFLGHRDPQQLIHDLDMMKQMAAGH